MTWLNVQATATPIEAPKMNDGESRRRRRGAARPLGLCIVGLRVVCCCVRGPRTWSRAELAVDSRCNFCFGLAFGRFHDRSKYLRKLGKFGDEGGN